MKNFILAFCFISFMAFMLILFPGLMIASCEETKEEEYNKCFFIKLEKKSKEHGLFVKKEIYNYFLVYTENNIIKTGLIVSDGTEFLVRQLKQGDCFYLRKDCGRFINQYRIKILNEVDD